MASPDFSEYIDLTVNDLQPVDIYSLARDYALVALPEFDPRVGTIEDAMLEAMSYVAGLVTGAVNRLPDGLMEGILRLMGFLRREATLASGSVIFSAIDDTGLTIPAGTQVGYNETTADGVVMHVFETTSSVVIAEGNTDSDPVQIAAIDAGTKPVISDGTAMIILTPISRLFEATFDGAMTQGSETETDEEFFNRGVTYLASLSRSLATAEQVTNYIVSTYGEAFRAKAYDLTRLQQFIPDVVVFDSGNNVSASFAPETGSTLKTLTFTDPDVEVVNVAASSTIFASPGTIVGNVRVTGSSKPDYDGIFAIDSVVGGYELLYDYGAGTETASVSYPAQTPRVEFLSEVSLTEDDTAGSVTVFLSSSTGASLSFDDKAVIADDVRSKTIAGLNLYFADVIVAPLSVSVDIKVKSGYGELDVRTEVDDYLTAYLSPAQYPFTTIVRKNQLLSGVAQIAGVEYVDSLTLTSDDPLISYVDGSGDLNFYYKGVLPSANVTVASV